MVLGCAFMLLVAGPLAINIGYIVYGAFAHQGASGAIESSSRLVTTIATAARHPETHDAQNARRRAHLARASAKGYRAKDTWRHVAKTLDQAARGGDPLDVSVALRMVLLLEGISCRAA